MTAVLELRAASRRYGTALDPVLALDGVDLAVDPGEWVAVIGPSGSGKSTLLNILGCLDRPTSGTHWFCGEDTRHLDDRRLSRLRNRNIGFVFQSFHLVSHLTVLENVELPLFYGRVPRARRHARCRELCDRVGLSHRLHHLPNELSGGECQRAAIARALSVDPALILADEPTGNLDSKTTRDILDLLHELWQAGSTIVMITHDRDIASMAPRRVAMRDGRIESDTRAEGVPA